MRFFFVLAFMFMQTAIAANFENTKALIVTIDQKTLGAAASIIESQGEGMLRGLLEPMTAHGALGQAIGLLLPKVGKSSLINAWDDARAEWIEQAAAGKYDQIFIVRGDDTRDDGYMAAIWDQALTDFDVVDYVSMVHEGGQLIKDEWKVPKSTNKIRMIYTEACRGGSGKVHFAGEYGALVSAGHNDETSHPSASPLFSFTFLASWFNGASFKDALAKAWFVGSEILKDSRGFGLARFVANYNSQEEAVEGSIIKLAWHAEVDPANITITSPRGARVDGDVLEESIK